METQDLNKKRKGFSTPLFLLYQSISDDLIFWPLFDTLFLSLAKGYSDASISIVFTASLWLGIALKFVLYRPIKRLKAGTAMIIAAMLFLAAALLITFGSTLWWVIAGQCLYRLAFSFQEMSSVFLQNAVKKDGSKPNYIKIKDAANSLYSLVSLFTILLLNRLCNVTMMLPMYICIGFCLCSLILALYLHRYDNTDNIVLNNVGSAKPMYKKIDSSAIRCLVLSALAVVILGLGMENLRIAVKSDLSAIFDNQRVVYYFSLMLIFNRIIKFSGNIFAMTSVGKKHRNKGYLTVYVVIIVMTPILGLISCFTSGYLPIIFACLAYFASVYVYDPFGTRLSKMLIEYMNPENMKLLIYLNSTVRDVAKAAVSSLITLILMYGTMKGVMILLCAVAAVLIVFYIIAENDLERKSNNRIYTKWTKRDIDNTDSLTVTAAVLMCYGNVELSDKFTPLKLKNKLASMDGISEVYKGVRFTAAEDYDRQKLKGYFDEGRLCAVHIEQNGEYIWLPVLYNDADGIMLYSIEEKWIFANDDSNMDSMCSFII